MSDSGETFGGGIFNEGKVKLEAEHKCLTLKRDTGSGKTKV